MPAPLTNPDVLAQTEWVLVTLVREAAGIAKRGNTPKYKESVKLASKWMPEIFDEESYFVKKYFEPTIVKHYKQLAEGESKEQRKKIEPLDLIDERIGHLTKISAGLEEKDSIKKEIKDLKAARSFFLETPEEEDIILAHDIRTVKFGDLPVNHYGKYSDYKVGHERYIRVRLIHPNQGERKLGADLIYEQHDLENEKVRVIVVQYKIWDGKTLRWTDATNLEEQINKMHNLLCSNDYCLSEGQQNKTGEFRYPYCTAFLRPTDELIAKNSRLNSTGMHIPICKLSQVIKMTKRGNKIMHEKDIRNISISQTIFEECFNYEQLGSRWMSYTELEDLYRRTKILHREENITLLIQEFPK